jgi:MOSC domain-containing protein YiiM
MPSLNPSSNLQALFDAPMRPGRLAWIGLRTERRGGIEVVQQVRLSPEQGLVGDRYGGRPTSDGLGGKRQVTLIAAEDLAAVAGFLGREAVAPDLVRRNLVTEGLNLTALKGRNLVVGDAVLEITGECHPCSRMEEALGPGGYNALRGRGGLTARVIRAGEARVGDGVRRIERA